MRCSVRDAVLGVHALGGVAQQTLMPWCSSFFPGSTFTATVPVTGSLFEKISSVSDPTFLVGRPPSLNEMTRSRERRGGGMSERS